MRVFVDVDVQFDFCDPKGALYVPGSPNERFRSIVEYAVAGRHPLVGSVDSHAFDAWEFASNERRGPGDQKPNFPDHCVKGTAGWLKLEGTLPGRFRFVPEVSGVDVAALAAELFQGQAQATYFEKEVYSLFANPNAEAFLAALQRLSATPLEAIVFGVATDYCVRAAALGLRERGYATVVLSDAIRGISEQGSQEAIAAMVAAGCRIATSAEILT